MFKAIALFSLLFLNSAFADDLRLINYKTKDFNILLPKDTDAQRVNMPNYNLLASTFYMFNTPNDMKVVASVYKVKRAIKTQTQNDKIVEMVNGIKKSVGLDISKELTNRIAESIKSISIGNKNYQYYQYVLVDRVLSFYSTTTDKKLLLLMISVPEYITRNDEELIKVALKSITLT